MTRSSLVQQIRSCSRRHLSRVLVCTQARLATPLAAGHAPAGSNISRSGPAAIGGGRASAVPSRVTFQEMRMTEIPRPWGTSFLGIALLVASTAGVACISMGTPLEESPGSTPDGGANLSGPVGAGGSPTTGASGLFVSVSAGYHGACALKTDNTIACWGTWANPGGTFKTVSVGGSWPCGLRADGTVICWTDSGAIVGSGFTYPTGTFASLSVGYARACGVRDDGTVACWGVPCSSVEQPPSGTFTSVNLDSGGDFPCGVRTDGSLACWNQCLPPGSIPTPPSGTFASVSVIGDASVCAVRADGTVACWGDNTYGQATPPSGTFSSLSSGLQFACGVRTDGTVACWGDNTYGQARPPAGTFTSIGAGYQFACGVKNDGTLACWGDNSAGQSTPPAH